ncbi:MAG: hypothetical protein SFU87_00115 [Chitinophagaceae bacterium]|jgi:hypothetical protein|nr:hypothetical protein [Chitinophagaceae bacterium]
MYNYSILEPGCYYVIQEKEEDNLSLVKIEVETDHCLFVTFYEDTETQVWKRKTDPVHDIIELLSDQAVRAWESSYNTDEYDYEEDED